METLVLKNGKLVLENKIIEGSLLVVDGVITRIVEDRFGEELTGDRVVDLEGKTVIPGFVDVHIHGCDGADLMDCSVESLRKMSKFLATKGVTNFLPTTLTAPKDELKKALACAGELQNKDIEGANIFGVHMEGPYFDVAFKGAQDDRFMTKADTSELEEYLNVKKGVLKLMSLSASDDSYLEPIRFLRKNGVIVSIGHSNGVYENVRKAVEAGLSHATHTYNGMRGITHRELGIAGGVLVSDEINAEIIFDGIHVHPKAVELVIRAKGTDRVVLITDAMSATGLADGDYKLGKLDVYVKDNQARLKSNDALAGSVLTMDKAFRNVMNLGYSIFDAVKMSSTNACDEFGLNAGRIQLGKRADFAVLDDNREVAMTVVNGKIKFER